MRRWWMVGSTAVALVAVTVAIQFNPVQRVDAAVRDAADAHRPHLAYDIAVTLNRVGSGGALTIAAILLATYLSWRRRSPRPFGPVVVALVLVAALTESAKRLVHRPPPHGSLMEGLSYPSGHAVNAVVWYGVLTILAAAWLSPPAVRALRVGPPAVVVATNVYLGFHWLTDMVAGLLLGLLIDQIVTAIRRPLVDPGHTDRVGRQRPAERTGRNRVPATDQTRTTSTPAARNGARTASEASSSVTRV